jgi:hypothetical protein
MPSKVPEIDAAAALVTDPAAARTTPWPRLPVPMMAPELTTVPGPPWASSGLPEPEIVPPARLLRTAPLARRTAPVRLAALIRVPLSVTGLAVAPESRHVAPPSTVTEPKPAKLVPRPASVPALPPEA